MTLLANRERSQEPRVHAAPGPAGAEKKGPLPEEQSNTDTVLGASDVQGSLAYTEGTGSGRKSTKGKPVPRSLGLAIPLGSRGVNVTSQDGGCTTFPVTFAEIGIYF